jgi:hypothetical protein
VAIVALILSALVALGLLAKETYGQAVSHALAVLIGHAAGKLTDGTQNKEKNP